MSARPTPLPARGFAGEQILQIAGRLDRRGRAVKQVMRQPEQRAVAFGDQRMHRLVGIEESAAQVIARDLGRQRGRARAAVERVVAVPQRKPLLVVPAGDKADSEIRWTFVPLHGWRRALPAVAGDPAVISGGNEQDQSCRTTGSAIPPRAWCRVERDPLRRRVGRADPLSTAEISGCVSQKAPPGRSQCFRVY